MVSTVRRRPCPITVGATAKVQRVRQNSAGMGASMCLYPTFWVMPGALPVRGSPEPGGCYTTQEKCRRVRRMGFSTTCWVSKWMECSA